MVHPRVGAIGMVSGFVVVHVVRYHHEHFAWSDGQPVLHHLDLVAEFGAPTHTALAVARGGMTVLDVKVVFIQTMTCDMLQEPELPSKQHSCCCRPSHIESVEFTTGASAHIRIKEANAKIQLLQIVPFKFWLVAATNGRKIKHATFKLNNRNSFLGQVQLTLTR